MPPPSPPPTAGSVYHKRMHYAIPAFDTPATLADSWHEHTSIYAGIEAGTVEIDGMNRESRSAMPGSSIPAWLSPDHDDTKQNGVTDTIFHVKPKTIMYGDRYQPGFIPLPQVRVVP